MGSIPIPSSNTESLYSSGITEFLWSLKKRGYKETTIVQNYAKILKQLMKHCNIKDSESVLGYIANLHVSDGRKEVMIDVYANYCNYAKIPLIKPRYKRTDKLPFIPLEKDIESLLSALPRKLRIFTRAIYETGARSGEVFNLKWIDIDFQNCYVTVNNPEKGSNARRLKVSNQLIGLLSTLPRTSDYVFKSNVNVRIESLRNWFIREKKNVSHALCNPMIASITWKSLRHYKATMEYAKSKDILYVMNLLGHRNIKNTLVYTHLVEFKNDEYVCKIAKTVTEASALIESGYEYVCDMEGYKLFRKRK
ncbi:MAG: tyrosine-type recombinase/integrase [Candidatus Bathyarchaeota archaeon]|nr:tyrosine-type recombinase/integrase [Candidatus Bathyarchaeota archaeon]